MNIEQISADLVEIERDLVRLTNNYRRFDEETKRRIAPELQKAFAIHRELKLHLDTMKRALALFHDGAQQLVATMRRCADQARGTSR